VHIEYTPDFFFRTDILPFFSKGLLLDTGVLYLFLIGKHAPDKLSNMGYSKEDFDYLQKFLETITIKKLVITPHIFTEFYKHVQTAFSGASFPAVFDKMRADLLEIEEEPVNKNEILLCPHFDDFEIGEHSLYLAYGELPTAILTDEKRGRFDGKLKDDQKKLVMNFKNHILPYLYYLDSA
jgi:hypothetical protein